MELSAMRKWSKTRRTLRASFAMVAATLSQLLDLIKRVAKRRRRVMFSGYNHYYRNYCYLPLLLFEGISGKFIIAALRPGKRSKGTENAMILQRVLKCLRAAWPETHIVQRGDGHFANPELMELALEDLYTDFLFGLRGNSVLSGLAAPFLETNRRPT